MLYGRESAIAELDRRRAGVGGQLRHSEAIVKERSLQRAAEAGGEGEGEREAEAAATGGARDASE